MKLVQETNNPEILTQTGKVLFKLTHCLKYYCGESGGISSPACISKSQCLYMISCSLSLLISPLFKAKRVSHGGSVEPVRHIVFVSALPFHSTAPLQWNGLKMVFSQPPLISFKLNENIDNLFVRSAFQISYQPGTLKCAGAPCKTCPFIRNVEK